MKRRRTKGEGGVYQRRDGRWAAYVFMGFDQAGKPKRKYVYGKTQKEALAKKKSIESEINQGTYVEPSKLTVKEWMDQWLDLYYIETQQSTREWARRLIDTHVKPDFGITRLEDLQTEAIQRFIVTNRLHSIHCHLPLLGNHCSTLNVTIQDA